MSEATDISSLWKRFDRQFPVSRDLQACLETVHRSYRLFQIHDGHTETDGHLEEGLFATLPVIQHCVKDILAAGQNHCNNVQ